MNKTVTINISGIIFHIEEEAFDRLNKYLSTIRSFFNSSEGRDEIMADIESRIAELLQEKISPSKQVVTQADVEHVMNVMGKPEDIGGEEKVNAEEAENKSQRQQGTMKKRLFRDPDNKVLGGVCGGVAAYFNIDVVWIRVILVALTALGFSGVFVYIIMWIVVPEAKTTAEKLQMHGEAVDINNISKSVMEEAEQLKNKASSGATQFGKKAGQTGSELASTIGSVILRLLGFGLVVFGISLLIAYISGILGISIAGKEDASFNEYVNSIFPDSMLRGLAKLSIFLIVCIPIIAMLYGGIKLLFNIKYSSKWINISLAVLWLSGIVLGLYTGLTCYSNFDKYAENKDRPVVTQAKSDTLYMGIDMGVKYNNPNFIVDDDKNEHHVHFGNANLITENGNKYYLHDIRIHILPNHIDSTEVLVVKSARGQNQTEARLNASRIEYGVRQKDSALLFDDFLSTPAQDKWRDQEVHVYVKLPVNKVIYLDPSLKYVIDDVNNLTDTHDFDMVGRKWKMTINGLQCVDCQGLGEKDKLKKELEETKESLREIKEEIKEEMREEKEKLKDELHDLNHH